MRFDLAIVDACKAAQVPYDDLISTIAAGSYPCLPGVDPGSPRVFDETDLLALYIYGRLLAFGFGVLRAGEHACRVHSVLKSNGSAKSVSIVVTPSGGKRVVVERGSTSPTSAGPHEQIEFNISAIRQFLKASIQSGAEG